MNFVLRAEHDDFLQPIGVMYKKESAIASDAFRIYKYEGAPHSEIDAIIAKLRR